jgi:tripartite-type tricarboxylate transporter receptor subunit TctC
MAAAALAAAVVPLSAHAQGYPNRPIRLVVPYPPGGGVDKAGRIFADLLGAKMGQPIVVENKPGASSAMGIEFAVKAPPDGYTILLTNSDGMTMLPNLKKSLPYAVPKDFTFIARVLSVPLAVSISTKMPFNDMGDLIAYAKANPGKLRYGSNGVGSGLHLATLLLEKAAGIKMDHVPYKGSAASMNDLMGGHIEVSVNAVQAVAPLATGGKIKLLAITGPTRDPMVPNLPTLAELGMPAATVAIFYGIVGPPGMPPAIVNKLRQDTMAVLGSPEAKQKFAEAGFALDPLAGDDFEKFVLTEYRTMKTLAESEKISIED